MRITLLPSEKGDCLFVESDGIAILADGGMPGSYKEEVRPFLGAWAKANPGRAVDLLYVSHVDQDHIGGALRLLEDMVEWRVHNFKKKKRRPTNPPGFDEPPPIEHIWHNSFKAMVPENAGEIGTMLASRANTLSSSTSLSAQKLAASYRNIAASIPEAIKVSRRIASDQLAIPLNRHFGGKLAMVRNKSAIRLKTGSALSIRVLGPFEKDLEILRDYWNAWLQDTKNLNSVKSLEKWLEDNGGAIGASTVGLGIDDEIGRRKNVTEPNLASLMLLLEEKKPGGGKVRVLMTGDGHHHDVLAGLEHHGIAANGAGLHVDVLKIPHHGSEHNLDRIFAKRITADHYVFCANGEHENPDLRILEVLLESRLGSGNALSSNQEASRPFTVWLNCSVAYLDRKIAVLEQENKKTDGLRKARSHLAEVEKELGAKAATSGGRMTVRLHDKAPLVLQV